MFIGYAFHSVVYRFLVLRSDVLEPKKWHKKFDKVLLSYSYSYIDADIYIYILSLKIIIMLFLAYMLMISSFLELNQKLLKGQRNFLHQILM